MATSAISNSVILRFCASLPDLEDPDLSGYRDRIERLAKFVPKKNQQRIAAKRAFKNLSKVIYFRSLLTKTLPELIKNIPKLYYFLTEFAGIFHFLRFCAVAKSR
jgi:hypothetical protein